MRLKLTINFEVVTNIILILSAPLATTVQSAWDNPLALPFTILFFILGMIGILRELGLISRLLNRRKLVRH